jgi:hypothetical protein
MLISCRFDNNPPMMSLRKNLALARKLLALRSVGAASTG